MMKARIITTYDGLLDVKLPIDVLEIVDDMIEYKKLYSNTYSGIELYRNHLYQEQIEINKKKEEVIDQLNHLVNNPRIKGVFHDKYRHCKLVDYFNSRCLCIDCGNKRIKCK